MKIINLLCIIAFSFTLSACNYVKVETKDVTPKDSDFKNLQVISLNDSARKAIGAKNDTDLIVIYSSKEDGGGVKIITSNKLNFSGGKTEEIMKKAKQYKGKEPTLVVKSIVTVTTNSPYCWEYEDSRGNRGWWPVPNCPHN